MSSERDLQSKLDDLEAELNQKTVSDSQESNPKTVFPQIEINPSPQVKGWIDDGRGWFGTLPKAGKAAVIIGGVWLGFSILGAVLHVVSSVVSIAVVGLVVYIGYRVFNNSSN